MINFKHTDYTKAIFTSGMSNLFMALRNVTSCMPIRKVWLSIHWSSHDSHMLNNIILNTELHQNQTINVESKNTIHLHP